MKPNVLILYPDQMRYDCMGHSGNPVIKTPGLNRLAENGAFFRRAYTSFPLCCPFRASLLTGKYATSHGMLANHYPIPLNQRFLPQIMRENGYATAWIGKWHLNGGRKHDFVPKEYRLGFEHFIGFSRGHAYLNPIYYRDDDTTPYTSDMYEPDLQTCHLLEFIGESLREGRPFFAGVSYGPPHVSVDLAPDSVKYLYRPEEVPVGPTVPEQEQQRAREFIAKYYGMVHNIDNQIQRIVNFLEYHGQLDNTILIFVSDHGDMCGEQGGQYGKKTYYDGSMHVPFILHYPKLVPGGDVEQLVDPSVDIMPTILDLCGIPVPEEVEGCSLEKLLRQGGDASLPDYVFYQIPREKEGPEKHPYAERGFRTRDLLYVEREGEPAVLYDLQQDPEERFNLAFRDSCSDQLAACHERLAELMARFHDDWDKEAFFPPPNFQTHEEGLAFNKELYGCAKRERPPLERRGKQ